MKRYLTLALALLLAVACKQEKPFSVRMMESEISRCPSASMLDFQEGELKWNYTTGLELLSFLDCAERYGLDAPAEYARAWADSISDLDGNVSTYRREKYNLDHICPARIFFRLYDRTGEQRYRNVLDSIRIQIDGQPRTEAGPFWHKQVYPFQVWLDGLYMSMPFYAEYTARFTAEEGRGAIYDDIAREFRVASQRTLDPSTGLFRHAWDESRSMFWADPETGLSAHAWGRANGWYAVALVETLQWLPEGCGAYDELVAELQYLVKAIQPYADPVTGMWYQVLDCPGREGNYLESSCSAMFLFACLKGVRMGWLDKDEWGDYSRELYLKFVDRFIREEADGTISVTDCCAVAGLGGKQMRRGDYDYYLSEPVRDNDSKSVGPFIWASLEYELL